MEKLRILFIRIVELYLLINIDWFENSIKATLANRKYCMKNSKNYKTYGNNSWGLTPCIGPKGYCVGFGAMPCRKRIRRK